MCERARDEDDLADLLILRPFSQIYNRTTLQHSSLNINGHMKPAERLRYMDRYAVSGGKDAVVKVWAL